MRIPTESFYNISKSIKYLCFQKYFRKLELQWSIGNIPDMFLQYSEV